MGYRTTTAIKCVRWQMRASESICSVTLKDCCTRSIWEQFVVFERQRRIVPFVRIDGVCGPRSYVGRNGANLPCYLHLGHIKVWNKLCFKMDQKSFFKKLVIQFFEIFSMTNPMINIVTEDNVVLIEFNPSYSLYEIFIAHITLYD